MLLTIGMIMKNEERFLRDCLTAIKPILDNVDSELIIHDTGSTDNSIAIAKEFTNNVFEIEWRNDFAWARQQGFELAKGEWFLQLDADEIFEDVREIIDFFNNGEYKNYGNATVYIKDAENFDNINFNKPYKSLRVYKIIENMKWQGKIHEQLRPYAEPTKTLNTYVRHYGYVHEIVQTKNKNERYLSQMLEVYNEDISNYSAIFWLAVMLQDNPQIALQYAETALEFSKKVELSDGYLNNLQVYSNSVMLTSNLYNQLGEYKKALDFITEYFNLVPQQKLTEIAYVLKLHESIFYEQQNNFVQANKSAISAYNFKKLADNNQLLPHIGVIDQIDEIIFITQILKTFVSANLLADAIDWIDNFIEVPPTATANYKIDKYICY
ncbi:MAG: glycosyltransferase family 2 protein, partial [Firmicutes bacterium]|nr:glycosyltransferase family 2 protein [Bacillota bacterium]